LLPHCNIGVDGPDVIRRWQAQDRFDRVLNIKVYELTKDPFSLELMDRPLDRVMTGCEREIYYRTDAVDSCERLLMGNHPKNIDELYPLHFTTLMFACKLEPVDVFNTETPLQGEWRWCN
jgi:hypothetical protein